MHSMWVREGSVHFIRHLLDSRFSERPAWFWFLSPLLFLLSAAWSFVAKIRRARGYVRFPAGPRPLVICCGNVTIGGSGKSPAVRALARDFLSAGFPVAVVTRGVGTHSEQLVAVPPKRWQSARETVRLSRGRWAELSELGDEAREHFEILSEELPEGNLLVLQGRNRAEAMGAFAEYLHCIDVNPGSALCILDDGLQTFSAPRQINLCLWNPRMLRTSPAWTPPVGSYRETGLWSFRELLTGFDFRIWSRASCWEELGDFKASTRESLRYWRVEVDVERDLFLFERRWSRLASCDSAGWRWKGPRQSVDEVIQSGSISMEKVVILHGIANGEIFADSIRRLLPELEGSSLREVALPDHGALSDAAVAALCEASTVFCTAKDLFRWCDSSRFQEAAAHCTLIVCGVEVEITRMDGASCRFSQILNYRALMREVQDVR